MPRNDMAQTVRCCGEDGGGGHPRASRINPQGDVRTAEIRQRQEVGEREDGENGIICAWKEGKWQQLIHP